MKALGVVPPAKNHLNGVVSDLSLLRHWQELTGETPGVTAVLNICLQLQLCAPYTGTSFPQPHLGFTAPCKA